MSKWIKWILIILGSLIGLAAIAVAVVFASGRSRFNETYEVEVAALEIPTDGVALARGEHLVNAVAHCAYCHGEGLRGDYVENDPATVGVVVASNLTRGEGGIGAAYTVEDWVRTIRHGVLPEGRSAFVMPSFLFHVMSEDDLAATIAYLQTVPPVDNALPETKLGPMAYALLSAGPLQDGLAAARIDHDAPFAAAPEEGETAAYGAYLAEIAQCKGCHGPELAGGRACPDCLPGPNLTQGGELGSWTKDDFITVMRTGSHPNGRQLSEVMPWRYFGKMTDSELGALWAFLGEQPARAMAAP
jgi:mono/diheme cytochrome c family protein